MPEKYLEHVKSDDAIKERVRWAIGYIADNHGMTNEKLGKFMGVSTSTINSYRRKITLPGLDFFVILLYKYTFNMEWFVSGNGEPFPGARAKYPAVCGPEPAPLYNKDTLAVSQEINIDEAIGKTYKVLKSGTPYAVALYLNIQQFSSALDYKEELEALKDQVASLQRQVNRLSAVPTTATAQEDSSAA